jgi:hypothetical protein
MDQTADVLTKALPRDKFEHMKQLLHLTETPVEDNTDATGTPLQVGVWNEKLPFTLYGVGASLNPGDHHWSPLLPRDTVPS